MGKYKIKTESGKTPNIKGHAIIAEYMKNASSFVNMETCANYGNSYG